jgi:transcriptional regulator with XRE-family HTH domain
MKHKKAGRRKARKLIFDEPGLKAFAEQLKKVRKEKGFTQEELAYQSELSLSQIARIETYKINPTLSTIFQISRTLKVPLSKLFEFALPTSVVKK